jgi:hypothetical protein
MKMKALTKVKVAVICMVAAAALAICAAGIAADRPTTAPMEVELRMAELAKGDQILDKQEKVLRQVPLYSEVREQVQTDLSHRLALDTMTPGQLSAEATKLSDEFWKSGGDLSVPAHKLAYEARLLLELAHQRAPNDFAVSDKLVEAIQAYPLVYRDRDDRAKQRYRENNDELLTVRKAQFNQLQTELAAGRESDWNDFVRVYDYAWLVQWSDPQAAESVLDWLNKQVSKGKWSYYQNAIADWRDSLSRGKVYSRNIYISKFERGEPEPYRHRFGHRSMGYVGPHAQERGMVLTAQVAAVQRPIQRGQ